MSRSPFLSPSGWARLVRRRVPGQVVIQYTTRCNATCTQCGMRISSDAPRATMGVDQARRLIDALAERGVASISFTGGEPLLFAEDIAALADHAAGAGIRYIRTGTNGFLFRHSDSPDFAERIQRLADLLAGSALNNFWISLDSADPGVHERNRGLPGMVAGLRKALPIFHARGLYPAANLGINRLTGGGGLIPEAGAPFDQEHFRSAFAEAFRRFYSFAEELGFTTVNACYPMSLDGSDTATDAVYAATSDDGFIRFSSEEKAAMLRALYEVIPEFRHRLRIFTPRSALLALMRQHVGLDAGLFPCRGGIDFFFVEAGSMDTFPCGYRGGENLGKFWDLDLSRLDRKQVCEKCDWECFRDPSVLLKPLLDLLENPFTSWMRLPKHREFLPVWFEDLRYYRTCGWFDARSAPNYGRMARFARTGRPALLPI
ncbi:MAG: radical SAM protein [Desulfovibrio sp.]